MIYKSQYFNEVEKSKIIKKYQLEGIPFYGEENITEGNFLVFGYDEPLKPSEQEIINSELIYESMIKDMKITELETSHSDLMYLLMTTGVL